MLSNLIQRSASSASSRPSGLNHLLASFAIALGLVFSLSGTASATSSSLEAAFPGGGGSAPELVAVTDNADGSTSFEIASDGWVAGQVTASGGIFAVSPLTEIQLNPFAVDVDAAGNASLVSGAGSIFLAQLPSGFSVTVDSVSNVVGDGGPFVDFAIITGTGTASGVLGGPFSVTWELAVGDSLAGGNLSITSDTVGGGNGGASPVPEPSAALLFGAGLLCVSSRRNGLFGGVAKS